MKIFISLFLHCALLVFALPSIINGQGKAGYTSSGLMPGSPSGSYQSGFDNINYFNGNLNFSLPLLNVGGRGDVNIPISLNIDRSWSVETFDSDPTSGQNWVSYPVAETFSFAPKYNPGFMKGIQIGFEPKACQSDESGTLWGYTETLTRLTFTSANGTQTQFIDAAYNGQPFDHNFGWNPCYPSNPGLSRGKIFYSTDGSGSTYISDANIMESSQGLNTNLPMNGYLLLANGMKYRIDAGNVSWITDRNGNKTTFTYEYPVGVSQKQLKTITDSLGRIVTFYYGVDDSEPYGLCDKIVFDGFGGAPQIIRISKRSLSQVLRSDQILKTDSQLFGFTGYYGSNYTANVTVASAVWLPNGQNYKFKYNSYAELARVELPTGGIFEYDYASGEVSESTGGYFDGSVMGYIYRRIVAKRTYRENGVLDGTINIDRLPTNGSISVSTLSSTGALFNKVKHYYHGGPDFTSAYYSPTNYEPWYNGIEYQTEFYGTDGTTLIQRNLSEHINKPLTWLGNQTVNLPKDRRLSKQISITVENGQALAILKSLEYDTTTSDLDKYSYLNVKKSKAYNYKVLDLATAQNADIGTISSLFSESDLASVSETDYRYDAGYMDRHIRGLPAETRILNPANPTEILAKSQIEYDEQSQYYSMDDKGSTTGYEAPTGTYAYLRGNATTQRTWYAEENRWIQTHTQYDNFGNVRKAWDSSGDQNRFVEIGYRSQDYYAYPTSTITPAPDPTGANGTTESLTASVTYDFWTGKLTSVTDANGQIATIEYDDSLRPKKVIPPAGRGITEKIYGDTPGSLFVKVKTQVDAQKWAEKTSFMDNWGNVYKTQTKDHQGDVFQETDYDSFGRISRVSNPFRQGETKYWSKLRYDNQSRVVETYAPAIDGQTGASLGVVEFGISTVSGFIGNYTTATDASGRKTRSITNVFGNVIRVDEPTGNNALGALENPNQSSIYTYNVKGELVKIQQGQQNRYFMYDSFGRLLRVREPEKIPHSSLATTGNTLNNQWTSGFSYDDLDNVVTVKDAKGVVITNSYDKAGRVIKSLYSDGVTPQVDYYYDGKGLGLSQALPYAKGNLTKISNGISEERYTSFDNYGGILTSQQITDGQTYNFEYKYDGYGSLIEEKYPSGRVVKTHLNSDGGLSAISSKTANSQYKTYASNFDYAANGSLKAMMLGNGRWETSVVNERMQLTQIGLGSTSADTNLWKVNYDYNEIKSDNTTANTGNIAKQTITLPTTSFVQTYKYDALNRLVEAKENAGTASGTENWKQTFDYDRYGNRTQFYQKVGINILTIDNKTKPQVDPESNRFTTGQGYVYDFNGNLIQDAHNRSFTFDGDDKQTEVRDLTVATSPQNPDANLIGRYYYDGEGKRVKKVTNTETTVFVYDAGGTLVAEYSTQINQQRTTSYLTTDHLGSPRVITDKNGNVTSRRDFMPFGEEILATVGARSDTNLKYSTSGIDNVRQRFTGYEKDTETELDFAEARMYQNKHGRFTAPDPLLSSASLDNPQTFNRYAYVGNNPVNITDPSGLDWCVNNTTNVTEFRGENVKCNLTKETDVTGKQRRIISGSLDIVNGGSAGVGDQVILNKDGSVTLVSNVETNVTVTDNRSASPIEASSATISSNITPRSPMGTPGGNSRDVLPAINFGGNPLDEPLDNIQLVADTAGLIPVLGEVADVTSGVISLIRGDIEGVTLSVAALLPTGGQAAGVTKISRRLEKLADKLRKGPNGTTVEVRSKKEADQLLNAAFPDYQKVRGVGPEDSKGSRKKSTMERFEKGGTYRKDYSIDKATGRVRGHSKGNPHGDYPHINIKRRDKKKVMINIIK